MHMQLALFEKIKSMHSDKKILPKLLQDILGISADSAYRRLRGETVLSIDEAYKLSNHFQVSLADLESFRNNHVIFSKQPFIDSVENFEKYMQVSLSHLEQLIEDPNHLLLYTAKDIPIFYPYKYRKLGAFKIYVWMRSFFDIKQLNEEQHDMSSIPDSLLDLAHKQWEVYAKVNTIEIWNETTIQSLLNQIEYYFDAGLLQNKEEALEICDEFIDLLKLIYKQAIHGKRMMLTDEERPTTIPFKMYFNEVLIMDNNLIACAHGRKLYSIPYGAVNYINTTNEELTNDMYQYIMRQAHKSSLISDVSEKDRNRFFLRLRNRVVGLRERIETKNPFLFN